MNFNLYPSRLWLLPLAAAALTGCGATSVTIKSDFPVVVSEPQDIHTAIVFDPDFRNYVGVPAAKTEIRFGAAQVDVLTKAFQGLFRQVDVVNAREELQPGTELAG